MLPSTASSPLDTSTAELHHEELEPSGNETNNTMELDGTPTVDLQNESGMTRKEEGSKPH